MSVVLHPSRGPWARRRSARRLAVGVAIVMTAASGLTALTAAPAHALCAPDACGPRIPPPPPPPPPPPRPHRPGGVPALVVTMGDSYAAGTGAPDRAANLPWSSAVWQDPACQRSGNAAPTQAVAQLQAHNPYAEGIDYLSTACSGAQIQDSGVLAPQAGAGKDAQIVQVDRAIGYRPIDALVIGIGGNDVHFGDIVQACLTPWNNCSTGAAAQQFQTGLADLAFRFNDLIFSIQGGTNGGYKYLRSTVKDVWLTQYPDPVINSNGSWCNNNQWPDLVYNITAADSAWVAQVLVQQLNGQIQAAAARANAQAGVHPTWHVVPQPDFSNHGVCAGDRWVNTVGDSVAVQGDIYGTMHPNGTGQWVAGQSIYGALSYLDR
jgi:hypothetical protein